MMQGQPTLTVTAHGAQNLQDVETIGKQDPYVQFSTDFTNTKSFQKTFVHKDAGKTPTWNQTFSFVLAGEPELFVEIMDEETTADAVIAFAAIPINQIVHAPGGTFNGIFDVYTPSGKTQGEINLTLVAHNVPGQNTSPAPAGQPVKGTSHINIEHQKRMKSLANREKAADAGTAAFGGLLAVGAGLLANKLVNDNKKEAEAKKEAERAAAAERERFENEKHQLEAQRHQFEQQQQQAQQQQQSHIQVQGQHGYGGQSQFNPQEHHQGGYDQGKHKKDKKDKKSKHHGGSGSDSDSSSDSDSDNDKKKKGKKWDAHGRHYSAGDKVKYDGDKYICLQSHNSQSDWAPTVAHSLWRRD
ncbi:C2 domain-containing protein [Linnemannia elongata]|nr:C2 domain-containing protein [Linnemannia elongata]